MTTPTPELTGEEYRDHLLKWAWTEDGLPWEHEVLSAVADRLCMTRQGVREAAAARFGATPGDTP